MGHVRLHGSTVRGFGSRMLGKAVEVTRGAMVEDGRGKERLARQFIR